MAQEVARGIVHARACLVGGRSVLVHPHAWPNLQVSSRTSPNSSEGDYKILCSTSTPNPDVVLLGLEDTRSPTPADSVEKGVEWCGRAWTQFNYSQHDVVLPMINRTASRAR